MVLVTDTTAIPAVASAFDDAVRRSPEWSDLDLLRNLPLSFRGARRGWAELYRWRRAFDDRMPAAMTYSDIDERSNQIEVGIDEVTATAAVRALSEDIGIPEAAFLVQPSARVRPQSRLRGPWIDSLAGYRRPPLAGMELEQVQGRVVNGVPASSAQTCTLGANVSRVGSPDPLFLTNSHCTQSLFEVDSLAATPGGTSRATYLLAGRTRTPSRRSPSATTRIRGCLPVALVRLASSAGGAMLPW